MNKKSTAPAILAVSIAALISGCDSSNDGSGASSSDGGSSSSPTMKFIGEKQVCIDYEVTGMQSGTKTRCYRNWGAEQLEITDVTMRMGPMSQTTKDRTVSRGAEIIRVDETTGTATKMNNPMYNSMVEGMRKSGKSAQDFGSQMFSAMGGSKTDETRTIAGNDCTVWSIPQMGQTSCIDDDGLMLLSETNMGFSMKETAVAVRRGDAGPADKWNTDGLTIQQMPDFQGLGDFMPTPP